ncbi:MAG: fibrobacter succinogenes major paralogous domain-containing protein, partial [Bacteroidota bacterium]
IVVILLIYGFWPGGSNPSSEARNYSDLKNENIDIQNITDSKSLDSSISNEIKIGSQVWMNKNLNVAYFLNGDAIPEAGTIEDWDRAIENQKPAWCYYDFSEQNGKSFGKIYNWFAVNDPRGLAPEGWVIPDENDWNTLIHEVGGESNAGAKLMDSKFWNDQNRDETNESGFSALPGGILQGGFDWIYNAGYWWCSSTDDEGPVQFHILQHDSGIEVSVSWENMNFGTGLYVRCIKNE